MTNTVVTSSRVVVIVLAVVLVAPVAAQDAGRRGRSKRLRTVSIRRGAIRFACTRSR